MKKEKIQKILEKIKKEDKKQISAHQFTKKVYEKLDINLNKLGYILLETEPILFNFDENNLYKSKNKDRFWINGYISDKKPHCTLLYGLLESGQTYKKYVDTVLKDWKLNYLKIENFDFFNSPYKDDNYFCIVAKIEVTNKLMEGHNRLEFLPHINTFDTYKPHITIAYIKKDESLRDKIIEDLNKTYSNKLIKIKNINYGGNDK